MSVLSTVAELERDLLLERTASGLARAREAGKMLGRPRALSAKQRNLVQERLAQGHAVAAIALDLGTSRQTIMRIRKQTPATAP